MLTILAVAKNLNIEFQERPCLFFFYFRSVSCCFVLRCQCLRSFVLIAWFYSVYYGFLQNIRINICLSPTGLDTLFLSRSSFLCGHSHYSRISSRVICVEHFGANLGLSGPTTDVSSPPQVTSHGGRRSFLTLLGRPVHFPRLLFPAPPPPL